ncbi:MAG: hypothetical protein FWF71_06540 [Actinomycetia bacterium]|nr:hypothetical protein [Actinomycetes bacterium]
MGHFTAKVGSFLKRTVRGISEVRASDQETLNKLKRAEKELKASKRVLKADGQARQMLAQWLELNQQGQFLIGSYLCLLGYHKVAVFSALPPKQRISSKRDIIDTLLVRELSADPNIEVTCLISDNRTTIGDLPSIKLAELPLRMPVDAVIIPLPQLSQQACEALGSNIPILHLSQIISQIHSTFTDDAALARSLVALRNRGVAVQVIATPNSPAIEHPSAFERYLLEKKIKRGGSGPNIQEYFKRSHTDELYSLQEYQDLLRIELPAVPYKDYWRHTDVHSDKVNIVGGERLTTDLPESYNRTLHVFGDSTALNYGMEDRFTVASCLQRLINQNNAAGGAAATEGLRVINHSLTAASTRMLANKINDTAVGDTDMVVVIRRNGALNSLFGKLMTANGIFFYDTQPEFERPHDDGEVFLNQKHPNFRGTQKLASIIFRLAFGPDAVSAAPAPQRTAVTETFHPDTLLYSYNQLSQPIPALDERAIDTISQSAKFRAYLKELEAMRTPTDGRVGAIVMNCNPFTKGHQFLIETCVAKVDKLYIFAVEEDRSEFPFNDRIELIRAGVAHLSNVEVLPSGNFIISTLTFPEYFQKGDLQEVAIDPSNDVDLFGRHIAPALGISIRFVGEEPLDKVTLQYNQTMQRLLPDLGVDVEVIARIEHGGAPISASRVRRLLATRDFAAIAEIVPATTLTYLKERFSD